MVSKQLDALLEARLHELCSRGALRTLPTFDPQAADLCSNDYLGLSRDPVYRSALYDELTRHLPSTGSTGSRLISGTSAEAVALEEFVAHFHRAESSLVFNSGYDANVSLLSALAQKEDVILFDRLVHASLRDGAQLSRARSFGFAHNDLNDLREKLSRVERNGASFIVVESVYSMDGDFAPLSELVELSREFSAFLIVDEAHATGVYGPCGEGRVVELGIQEQVPIRIHTFGKALCSQGSAVLCSTTVRSSLINFARPFIYTTAPSPLQMRATLFSYRWIEKATSERARLFELISYFQKCAFTYSNLCSQNLSPIQYVLVPGNDQVCDTALRLKEAGLNVQGIRSPTVARGKERIRICLHSDNSESEIDRLFENLSLYQMENMYA